MLLAKERFIQGKKRHESQNPLGSSKNGLKVVDVGPHADRSSMSVRLSAKVLN